MDFEDETLALSEVIRIGETTFNRYIHGLIANQNRKLTNSLSIIDNEEFSILVSRRGSNPIFGQGNTKQNLNLNRHPSNFSYTSIPPVLSCPLSNMIFQGRLFVLFYYLFSYSSNSYYNLFLLFIVIK